jgi:hypothetical protein
MKVDGVPYGFMEDLKYLELLGALILFENIAPSI